MTGWRCRVDRRRWCTRCGTVPAQLASRRLVGRVGRHRAGGHRHAPALPRPPLRHHHRLSSCRPHSRDELARLALAGRHGDDDVDVVGGGGQSRPQRSAKRLDGIGDRGRLHGLRRPRDGACYLPARTNVAGAVLVAASAPTPHLPARASSASVPRGPATSTASNSRTVSPGALHPSDVSGSTLSSLLRPVNAAPF